MTEFKVGDLINFEPRDSTYRFNNDIGVVLEINKNDLGGFDYYKCFWILEGFASHFKTLETTCTLLSST